MAFHVQLHRQLANHMATAFKTGRHFLHTPGPTFIPERVLNAMHRQPLELNDAELLSLTQGCFDKLQAVFRTKSEIFVYIANGHGGWEAVLSNLFAAGDCVLLPETGYFSNSSADSTCRIKAILAVHTDAATGITSDITAIRRAIDAEGHPALLVMDERIRHGRLGRGRGLLSLSKGVDGSARTGVRGR